MIAAAPRVSALTLVEVVGVTIRYRRRAALDGVSFTVREGEIVGLVGPAGAGKTACLDGLAGAVAPAAGRIIFDGRDVTGAPRREMARAGIARAEPLAAGRSTRSVADEVVVAAGRSRYGGAAPLLARLDPRHRGAARGLLERVGLAEVGRERAAGLPPAMRRRLEIARALAARPRLLLLDEPMAGLSAGDAAAIAALVTALRAGGLTVVLAARRAPEAPLLDRAVTLRQGRAVASAPAPPAQPVLGDARRGRGPFDD